MTHELNLKTIPNRITDAGVIRAFVVELFYGWGYNAYKTENQLRADDELVRNEISGLLCQARKILAERETAFRREYLPPPTRDKPIADPESIKTVQEIVRKQHIIEALETAVRSAESPLDDRMIARHRDLDRMLAQLLEADLRLAEASVSLLLSLNSDATAAPLDQNAVTLVEQSLAKRRDILSILCPPEIGVRSSISPFQ